MGGTTGDLARTDGRRRAVAVARALGRQPDVDQIQELVRIVLRRTPELNLVQSILGRRTR